MTLHLAFDAKRAFLNKTGLGNYSRTLLTGLSTYFPETKLSLFSPPSRHLFASFEELADSKMEVVRPKTFWGNKFHPLWRSFYVSAKLKKSDVALYHGLSHELPFGIDKWKGKKVVTIHDLIYLRHPEFFPWLDRKVYDMKFRYACKVADKVIAISGKTKEDLVEFFGVKEDKIVVHHQSCHPKFFEPVNQMEIDRVRDHRHLPKDYLLFVGALSERKNPILILKALALLPENLRIPLVIVGEGESYKQKMIEEAKRLGIESLLLFQKSVSTDELQALYAMAKIFIYPSFFEGFGIPIIEASFMKTAVITSKGSCFSEPGGPHTLYIDPYSAEDLKDSIEKLLTDDLARHMQVQAGYQFVQRFHLKETTKKLVDIYGDVLKG